MTLFYSILVLLIIIHQNFAQNDKLENSRYILDSEIEMQHCGCKRKIKQQSIHKIVSFNQTTCSLDAYNRGLGQKIIGFSLYGNHTDKLMYVFIFLYNYLINLVALFLKTLLFVASLEAMLKVSLEILNLCLDFILGGL